MIPVYQTIMNNVNGNCCAAVIASLLEIPLSEVPNFVEQEDDFAAICDFLKPFGYEWGGYLINPHRNLPEQFKNQYQTFGAELPPWGDFNGFYEATVFSPGYFDSVRYANEPDYVPTCHAVVIDRNFNVVHDPCPLYKYCEKYPLVDVIGYNGVIGVSLWLRSGN